MDPRDLICTNCGLEWRFRGGVYASCDCCMPPCPECKSTRQNIRSFQIHLPSVAPTVVDLGCGSYSFGSAGPIRSGQVFPALASGTLLSGPLPSNGINSGAGAADPLPSSMSNTYGGLPAIINQEIKPQKPSQNPFYKNTRDW